MVAAMHGIQIDSITAKFIYCAIEKYQPTVHELRHSDDPRAGEAADVNDLFVDVREVLESQLVSFDDPTRAESGEADEVRLTLDLSALEVLCRTVNSLRDYWRQNLESLQRRSYKNQETRGKIRFLAKALDLLDHLYGQPGRLFSRFARHGTLTLLEREQRPEHAEGIVEPDDAPALPPELIARLPEDVQALCNELNFNCLDARPLASMLLMRRLLPLCIVRAFQARNQEEHLKERGTFAEAKQLVGKAHGAGAIDSGAYSKVVAQKILLDATQHDYSFSANMKDVAITLNCLRVTLGQIAAFAGW